MGWGYSRGYHACWAGYRGAEQQTLRVTAEQIERLVSLGAEPTLLDFVTSADGRTIKGTLGITRYSNDLELARVCFFERKFTQPHLPF
jgi:hypothetical protein